LDGGCRGADILDLDDAGIIRPVDAYGNQERGAQGFAAFDLQGFW
jgi:hypothetical protein